MSARTRWIASSCNPGFAVMRNCTKTVLHPEVGPLALVSEVLLDSTGEQSLVLYTAQPGTDTADKLQLLRVLGRERFTELREAG